MKYVGSLSEEISKPSHRCTSKCEQRDKWVTFLDGMVKYFQGIKFSQINFYA